MKFAAGRKTQRLRHAAGDSVKTLAGKTQTRQRFEQALCIRMKRLIEKRFTIGKLGDSGGIHYGHVGCPLGNDAEVVSYKKNAHLILLLKFVEQVQNLRLYSHIERGSRLIGNQQSGPAGYGHRNHNPLSHPARHLMRVFGYTLARVRNADLSEHLNRKPPGLVLVFFLVQPNGLDNLVADGIDGIQAGHRLLKYHRYMIAADGAHSRLG